MDTTYKAESKILVLLHCKTLFRKYMHGVNRVLMQRRVLDDTLFSLYFP